MEHTQFTNLMPHDRSLERASNASPEAVNAQSEVAALKAQRDELLAALEALSNQSWRNGLLRIEQLGLEALIAKHKEASHG